MIGEGNEIGKREEVRSCWALWAKVRTVGIVLSG